MTRTGYRNALVAIFVLQASLLSIGITHDYRLKHEDNNALHATFARSHLRLGLEVTKGQNYFYNPADGTGTYYANHPPGPGLVLSVAYGLTGHDGPFVTRATAGVFQLLASWFLYGLARRVLATPSEVLVALLLFAVLPESSFFGRMMNHEVLVLPASILLVRGYWEWLNGDWTPRRRIMVTGISAAWATLAGWAGFFVLGACALHAAWEAIGQRNPRARSALAFLVPAGAALLALDMAQLLWVLGGDATYLSELLGSRMGAGSQNTLPSALGRVLELHWRYFGLTSALGLCVVAYRAGRGLRSGIGDPAVHVAAIFLLAGAAYVAVFNFNAMAHDYWQFLWLPAGVLGITLVFRHILAAMAHSGRRVWQVLLILAIADISIASTVTLVQRHVKSEGRCLTVVADLRRNFL